MLEPEPMLRILGRRAGDYKILEPKPTSQELAGSATLVFKHTTCGEGPFSRRLYAWIRDLSLRTALFKSNIYIFAPYYLFELYPQAVCY